MANESRVQGQESAAGSGRAVQVQGCHSDADCLVWQAPIPNTDLTSNSGMTKGEVCTVISPGV